MPTIEHSVLSTGELHEPKGIASAASGTIYVADGVGSGEWIDAHSYIHGYVDFDATTPAYQHSVTTAFTALDPTFVVDISKGFSGATTPNARLVYTGTTSIVASCSFIMNYKNDSGTSRDLELNIYKNGTATANGHVIVTAATGEWRSSTLFDYLELTTDDYIEVFVKGSAAFTLDIASAAFSITGLHNA